MCVKMISQDFTLQEVLIKAQRVLLLLSIITLPFQRFSKKLPLAGDEVPFAFIYLGILLCIVQNYLFPQSYSRFIKKSVLFLFFLILWNICCSTIGVLNYQYFNEIDLLQMDKLKNAYEVLQLEQYQISDLTAIRVWVFIRSTIRSITYAFKTYIISLWVYLLYWDESKKLLQDICNAVIILVTLMALYSTVEVGYLIGNETCKNILIKVNPLYMNIASGHGWWPPLLWKGQVRSLFLEPSYLGMTAAFLFPVLCSRIFEKVNLVNLVLLNVLILMIFLTKARTATLLLIGEIGLFGLFLVISSQKSAFKKGAVIFLSTIFMFGTSLGIMSRFRSGNQGTQIQNLGVVEYVEDNITSVKGNKRSNNARFGNIHATLVTGMKHPLFGVGREMQHTYIRDNFTEEEKQVKEIKLWINKMGEKGPLMSGFPILNEFSGQIAQTGILGLILFLMPIFFILKSFIKQFSFWDWNVISFFVAYIGLIVAMLSNAVTIPYFLTTGALLVFLNEYDKNERKDIKNE